MGLPPLLCYGIVGCASNAAGYLGYIALTGMGLPPKLTMTALYATAFFRQPLLYLRRRRTARPCRATFYRSPCSGLDDQPALFVASGISWDHWPVGAQECPGREPAVVPRDGPFRQRGGGCWSPDRAGGGKDRGPWRGCFPLRRAAAGLRDRRTGDGAAGLGRPCAADRREERAAQRAVSRIGAEGRSGGALDAG